MRKRLLGASAFVVALLSTAPAGADTTLGLTGQPGLSSPGLCSSPIIIAQKTDDPSSPYFVPAGGGVLTQWQTATTGDTAGAAVTFVVLRPIPGPSYRAIATDSETIPNPLPASGIAVFPLSTPVAVQQGDTFGLYSTSGKVCTWSGGATPSGDTVTGLTPVPPTANATENPGGSSTAGTTLNVAVNLVTSDDVAVTTTAGPPGARVGNLAVLRSTVSNGGPNSRPITFTDNVPVGLKINQVVGGTGTCTISGQKVTCSIPNVASGHSASLAILVTPGHAGSYANRVSAQPVGAPDPNGSNNAAHSTLKVSASPCVVPKLNGAPASLAKQVLKLLGCKVKLKHVTGGGPSGTVVKTKPGPGTYAHGRTVTVSVAT